MTRTKLQLGMPFREASTLHARFGSFVKVKSESSCEISAFPSGENEVQTFWNITP